MWRILALILIAIPIYSQFKTSSYLDKNILKEDREEVLKKRNHS